ncbi:MAG: 2'-5' RNA ligase family protein [Bacteroidetes bacterium]|nr:2'-5' RNA ligase family protein [Bacteroidota bacterium]
MLENTYVYLLVINPKGVVERKSVNVKNVFRYDYGCALAAYQSHITLSQFLLFGRQEEYRAVKSLKRFFSSRKSFSVEMDGFDHFKTHTIFMNVKTKEPIVKMVKGMRKRFRTDLMPHESLPPYFSLKPHLTIARRMRPDQFEKAWPDWQNHKFKGNFDVDEVVLIKRPYPGTGRYEEVERFNLTGSWEDGEQLQLPF